MKNKEKNTVMMEAATKDIQESSPKKPWHRPRLESLRLSLDTAFTAGSASDLAATGSL